MTDRKSRWGTSSSSTNSKSNNVDDEAALQALLSSAQKHQEQQRSNEEHNKKRPRHDNKTDTLTNNKDDYYGPDTRTTEKPNFGLSGALTKDTRTGNVYKGVVLKFQEPPEARTPSHTQWRFYVFKDNNNNNNNNDDTPMETLHVSRQSAYLIGRNADICDILVQHPSCSAQHAVLQYRALPRDKDGRLHCQPYILDLESTNGTFLNGVRIDAARYYQLKQGDVLKFGASTREYVLLTATATGNKKKKNEK